MFDFYVGGTLFEFPAHVTEAFCGFSQPL